MNTTCALGNTVRDEATNIHSLILYQIALSKQTYHMVMAELSTFEIFAFFKMDMLTAVSMYLNFKM
jgi:hypothetical protein